LHIERGAIYIYFFYTPFLTYNIEKYNEDAFKF
jgi:hypothetical protein